MASKSISSAAIFLLYVACGAAAPLNQAATGTLTAAAAPATFTANPNVGPGGSTYTDSAHFRVYGATGSQATSSLNMLEGAYDCFTNTIGWRIRSVTSSLCASARSAHGQSATATEINLQKVIGDSYQVIVDGSANTGNYYEA
ncbi:hypothetical protein GGR55DRAFT_674433 [Xylaria sp. FL0064]|nr:hypothetical protein GGR55DRAFT_674433 [Xylaria sp. FL0064]